jgi:YHS domain-containing protein
LTSLIYFLAFGFLFYWMMRQGGCGMHGYNDHADQAASDRCAGRAPRTVRDPVCGMDVDVTRAAGTRCVARGTFHLCSTACLAKFDRDPQEYAGRVLPAASLPGRDTGSTTATEGGINAT